MKKAKIALSDEMFNHRTQLVNDMRNAHFHNNYEIYFFDRGKGKISYLIDRNLYTVCEGDLILVPAQSLHRVMYSGFTNAEFSRYLLSFRGSYIHNDLMRAFDIRHYQLTPEDCDTVRDIMQKIEYEYTLFDEFFSKMYKQYLNALLVLLVRKYNKTPDDTPHYRSSVKIDFVISEMISYIHKNIEHDISLTVLSEKYGYSKEYISSQFKNTIGCGFNEYLTKTRIAHTVKLLTSSSKPIKHIATKAGFKNSNYFAAVFKSYMNLSPNQYRKLYNSSTENDKDST